MKRVSIKDVAREAGVSATTVSYVLNRNPDETISAETTQRVLEAVRRLHYVPNLNARSLSSRRSNLIGVLIPQTEPGKEFMFSNPFYGELLSAIEYTARKNGYHLLLSGTQEDQSYVSVAQNRGVDGIIIVGAYPGRNLEELRGMNVPIVLVDSYVKDAAFHTIGIEVIVHLILGLPGETAADMEASARYVGRCGAEGVKLHLLHILRGTPMAAEYAAGRVRTLELDEYITLLERCLEVLPPEAVIHRLTGDAPKRDLIAPLWSADKKRVLNAIRQRFESDDLIQGSKL